MIKLCIFVKKVTDIKIKLRAYDKLASHYPIKSACLHIGKVTSMRAGWPFTIGVHPKENDDTCASFAFSLFPFSSRKVFSQRITTIFLIDFEKQNLPCVAKKQFSLLLLCNSFCLENATERSKHLRLRLADRKKTATN